MKVQAKDMHMTGTAQATGDIRTIEPTFFGSGRANITMFKVIGEEDKVLDEALLQVSPAGKLVLVRAKSK